jgi:hypothetical protein
VRLRAEGAEEREIRLNYDTPHLLNETKMKNKQ